MARAEWVGDQCQEPIAFDGRKLDGLAVLDVGCGTGKDLLHPVYSKARERCGIDPDPERIGYGRGRYPQLHLACGRAESLPYPDEHFDFVVSHVALPYTQIGAALKEIRRVLKQSGSILLTMHDWRMERRWLLRELRARSVRGLLRHAYVILASCCYMLTGYVPRLPWADARETFQTEWAFRRSLRRAGFDNVRFERRERDWIITADIRPDAISSPARRSKAADGHWKGRWEMPR